MCRFCERAGKIVMKITVCKFEETRTVYDGIFQRVPVGTKTSKKQPIIKLEMGRGCEYIPMPVEFKFCPHCGRKISKESK